MKVYIIAQAEDVCGAGYAGKVFDSEEKAKSYVKRKNNKIYKEWLKYSKDEASALHNMRLKEYGSHEAYAKHMLDQESYFYYIADVE